MLFKYSMHFLCSIMLSNPNLKCQNDGRWAHGWQIQIDLNLDVHLSQAYTIWTMCNSGFFSTNIFNKYIYIYTYIFWNYCRTIYLWLACNLWQQLISIWHVMPSFVNITSTVDSFYLFAWKESLRLFDNSDGRGTTKQSVRKRKSLYDSVSHHSTIII